MKEVPVGNLVALVDDADHDLVAQYSWSAKPTNGGVMYARRTLIVGRRRYRTQFMHSLITGWPIVDHCNHNGLDNRRVNLRPATRQQNRANSRKHKTGTSRFKGVTWDSSRASWLAQIRVNKKLIHLGRFANEEEAACAYDEAAHRYFGQFAYPNFGRPPQ